MLHIKLKRKQPPRVTLSWQAEFMATHHMASNVLSYSHPEINLILPLQVIASSPNCNIPGTLFKGVMSYSLPWFP